LAAAVSAAAAAAHRVTATQTRFTHPQFGTTAGQMTSQIGRAGTVAVFATHEPQQPAFALKTQSVSVWQALATEASLVPASVHAPV
jgi:hypothetical protein